MATQGRIWEMFPRLKRFRAAYVGPLNICARTKRAWAWFTQPARLFGLFVFCVGVPGLLDDIGAWSAWLANAAAFISWRLPDLPVEAVVSALGQPPVYWGLLFIGAIFVLQAERIVSLLRRWRHRVELIVATQMNTEKFIEETDAVNVIMQSRWARTRRARNEKPKSILDSLAYSASYHKEPARGARNQMFRNWCEMALSVFEREEKEAVETSSGKKQYDEVRLRAWLNERYTVDLTEEFGPI